MLIHIVSPGENIESIAAGYHCCVNDIKSNNLHITDFSHLVPGSKLKIPYLSKEKMEILEETEPFISDYYPTYNGYLNGSKAKMKEEVINPVIIEEAEVEVKTPVVEEKKVVEKVNKTIVQPYGSYSGNIRPNYNQKYIRKI